jgi:hypothetical protein
MSTLLSIVARAFISSPPPAVEGIANVVGTLTIERTKIMIPTAARMALSCLRGYILAVNRLLV